MNFENDLGFHKYDNHYTALHM